MPLSLVRAWCVCLLLALTATVVGADALAPRGYTHALWRLNSGGRRRRRRILYDLYLPTVILTIILVFHHPLTLSFPSFSANPSHCSPSFLLLKYSLHGFPGLFTVISEHICFLLLVLLFLHFFVVGSVR